MKNYNINLLLFCFIFFIFPSKNQQDISIIQNEEEYIEYNNIRDLDEETEITINSSHYHKSAGGLSGGGVVGIATAGVVVVTVAVVLAVVLKGTIIGGGSIGAATISGVGGAGAAGGAGNGGDIGGSAFINTFENSNIYPPNVNSYNSSTAVVTHF